MKEINLKVSIKQLYFHLLPCPHDLSIARDIDEKLYNFFNIIEPFGLSSFDPLNERVPLPTSTIIHQLTTNNPLSKLFELIFNQWSFLLSKRRSYPP
jgi:hypothetical protein